MSVQTLLIDCLLAVSLAFLVTGSVAGYYVRFLGYLILKHIKMDGVLFCPGCCSVWLGFFVRFSELSSYSFLDIKSCVEVAAISYLLASVIQAAFGLAANDREQIESTLSKSHTSD